MLINKLEKKYGPTIQDVINFRNSADDKLKRFESSEERIEELKNLGVMLQMNYAHIGGSWFDADTKWCRQMLKAGYIDILSTDMHNSTDKGLTLLAAVWCYGFLL